MSEAVDKREELVETIKNLRQTIGLMRMQKEELVDNLHLEFISTESLVEELKKLKQENKRLIEDVKCKDKVIQDGIWINSSLKYENEDLERDAKKKEEMLSKIKERLKKERHDNIKLEIQVRVLEREKQEK